MSSIAKDALISTISKSNREARASIVPTASVILDTYEFKRDDETTRLDYQGNVTQIAMRLTSNANPGETLLVIHHPAADEWFICDMANASYDASAYIAAVKQRVEDNRARCLSTERMAQAA